MDHNLAMLMVGLFVGSLVYPLTKGLWRAFRKQPVGWLELAERGVVQGLLTCVIVWVIFHVFGLKI